ncbi:unnamed protein product [Symbiodinium necroappetens]|uniref:Uncharacterized protein n=1 Tax=Symbiodinium necroappetens TaxID=1628268 RepID=A0A813CL30_9DINO|nr:unnamed protein product [Symbiodinium necroappetens]
MRNWNQEALDYLREEIKATTADAEARINKAAESVTTLKDMIQAKQVELIQRRKEVSRLYHDAESVELENQKLQVQLTRASLHVGGQNQHDGEEAEQLRREAEDFHTQKEALLLILRDFYGAMGEEPPTLSAIVSKHQLRTKQLEPDGDKVVLVSSSWPSAPLLMSLSRRIGVQCRRRGAVLLAAALCFEAVRRLAFSVPLGSGPAALEQGSIGQTASAHLLPRQQPQVRSAALPEALSSVQDLIQQVPDQVAALGPAGIFYFFGIYVVAECLALPAAPLTLSSGYLFGLPVGAVTSVLAGTGCLLYDNIRGMEFHSSFDGSMFCRTTAAAIGFLLSRTFLRPQIQQMAEENETFRDINKASGKFDLRDPEVESVDFGPEFVMNCFFFLFLRGGGAGLQVAVAALQDLSAWSS